jgi:lysophospholipase L1-like esterase
MPDLARTLLFPILAVQGMRLFKTIPRLPEPSGLRIGVEGEGRPLRLLIVGDSSGAGVGVETQDEALLGRTVSRLAEQFEVHYRLIARHGSTLTRTLGHLKKQSPEPFDVALVALGLNDIIAGQPFEPWMASYRDLVAELRERWEVRHVVASAMPPVGEFPAIPNPLRWTLGRQATRYDDALKTWATAEPETTYIDLRTEAGDPLHGVPITDVMATDGFHPGPRIYDEWGRRAARAIADAA